MTPTFPRAGAPLTVLIPTPVPWKQSAACENDLGIKPVTNVRSELVAFSQLVGEGNHSDEGGSCASNQAIARLDNSAVRAVLNNRTFSMVEL